MCICAQSCPSLCDPMDCSLPASAVHGISPGNDTGVGCHSLLQGIFLTRGSNPCLLHWQADSLPLSHLGNLKFTWEPPDRSNISLLNLKGVSASCCFSENFLPFSTPGPSPHVIREHPGSLPALPVTLKGAAALTKVAALRAPKSVHTAAGRAEQ